jgi:hypothetical protein
MKHARLLSLFVVLCLANFALAGNYILVIDGQEYEVDLDEKANIKLADGKTLNVTLKKKPILAYKTDMYSFDHPSEVTPARENLGEGIHQMMVASVQGTVIMVQEYTTLDPAGLIDMMVNELTKEERQYGYKFLDVPYQKKLADDKTIATGKQSISSIDGDQTTRQVLSISGKDKGLLIITIVNKAAPDADKKMVETFWQSLKTDIK